MATEPLPPEAEAVIQTGMDAAAVEDGDERGVALGRPEGRTA